VVVRSSRRDEGTVTAETAVVLPALAAVLLCALWAVATVTAELRCVDAARTAARALARGDSEATSVAAARAAAPAGAQVVVTRVGGRVVVDVRATSRLPGRWAPALPGLALSAHAVAPVEDLPTGTGP
jgi:Flp pilus assembly protein TadG